MKKYILPIVVVFAFVLYVVLNSQKSTPVAVLSNQPTTVTSGKASNTGDTGISQTPTAGGGTPTTGMYKDGTYDGIVADAFYGKLQVEAVIQGGKLVDCKPLQYPNESGHTAEVSASALPALKQEAIQSQSANVNIVSGATQTSQAFQQSLGAALALAKN